MEHSITGLAGCLLKSLLHSRCWKNLLGVLRRALGLTKRCRVSTERNQGGGAVGCRGELAWWSGDQALDLDLNLLWTLNLSLHFSGLCSVSKLRDSMPASQICISWGLLLISRRAFLWDGHRTQSLVFPSGTPGRRKQGLGSLKSLEIWRSSQVNFSSLLDWKAHFHSGSEG